MNHTPDRIDMDSDKKLIGYATYLNTRVSKCHYSDDINELHELVTNEMNNIPKSGNCSFIIEPNLRVDEPEGYDSYHDYYEKYYLNLP